MFKDLCKIQKQFYQHEINEWVKQDENRILLKLKSEGEYVDCFLFLDNNVINVDMIINKDSYLTIEKIKEYIKTIVNIPFDFLENSEEHDIDGIFLFPSQHFNKVLLSDMIMNNPLLSSFLAVEESIKASTKKTGLLLKFKGYSCNIICKTSEDEIETKQLGTRYVRARIKNFKDMEMINSFVSLLSKMFTIYHKSPVHKKLKEYYPDTIYNEKELYSIYKDFLGKFDLEEKEVEIKHNIKLEDTAPELFKSNNKLNYNRNICQGKNRHPKIIRESDITEQKENIDYILFPKDSDKQYFFSCKENDVYQYIGLSKNKLDNDQEFLPCCYKEKNNNIDEYYNEEEKKMGKQQIIIKTLDRLLPPSYIGELPNDTRMFIENLYQMKEKIYRQGVSTSNHSFLECIKKATDKNVEITEFEVASQENPDLTVEQMSDLFHKDVYLDPRRWIRLLEYYYHVNIYVFCRHGKNKDSKLMIPNHIGIHLKYDKQYPQTVFILENQKGNEKRCELIVFEKPSKFYKHLFENQSFIDEKIVKFYMTSAYKMVRYSKYPTQFKYKSQILDSYHKTRCLITTNNVYLLCDPIPPLPLPIVQDTNVESDIDDVKELLKTDVSNKDIKIGMFTIKIKTKNDKLNVFQQNKRTAYLLGELFIYLYSIYVNKNQISLETGKDIITSIKQFIDIHVTIDRKVKYKLVFSPIIQNIDNMKIKDNETLKRLICLLRLRLINNKQQVIHYYKQKEFFEFYKEIENYSIHINTLLVNKKQMNQIIPFSKVIYKSIQFLPKYFLLHQHKLYLMEQVNESDYNDFHTFIYDENMKLLGEIRKTFEKEVHLIKYQNSYQKMIMSS